MGLKTHFVSIGVYEHYYVDKYSLMVYPMFTDGASESPRVMGEKMNIDWTSKGHYEVESRDGKYQWSIIAWFLDGREVNTVSIRSLKAVA